MLSIFFRSSSTISTRRRSVFFQFLPKKHSGLHSPSFTIVSNCKIMMRKIDFLCSSSIAVARGFSSVLHYQRLLKKAVPLISNYNRKNEILIGRERPLLLLYHVIFSCENSIESAAAVHLHCSSGFIFVQHLRGF